MPYEEKVGRRFDGWMRQQENRGRRFTEQQVAWLEMIRDHVVGSLEIDVEDFELTPFSEAGGLGKATEVFGSGSELRSLLDELKVELAA
ncbi:MAG: type I restriction-modification enzyme R subunit C-terminal domain-containing protein [Thermoanaerobaculia bacterium]